MRERVKLDEAAGLRGESIEERGVGRGAGRTRTARNGDRTWLDMVEPIRRPGMSDGVRRQLELRGSRPLETAGAASGFLVDDGGR